MKTVLSLFLGVALIVVGTAVLTYQGVTLTSTEHQLLSFGPLKAGTQEFNWTITLPPILGAVLLAGGTVLVFVVVTVKRVPRHDGEPKAPAEFHLPEPKTK